jgi:hypothetical protein
MAFSTPGVPRANQPLVQLWRGPDVGWGKDSSPKIGVIESFLSKQYLLHPFTRLRSKIFDVLVSVVQDPSSHATSWRETPAGHMVV